MIEDTICLLDKIAQSSHTFYFCKDWANGKYGAITDIDGNCIYRFYEAVDDEQGRARLLYEKDVNAPIVIEGIVAFWIKYRKSADRLSNIFSKPDQMELGIKEQFDIYTEDRFKQFKRSNKDNPCTWNWDWEYEFYVKYIIPNEIRLNKQSEFLFDYITEADKRIVRSVMDNYIEYLKYQRLKLGYEVNDKLKVLRAIALNDDFLLEDMEDYEISVALDALEEGGYVKVAWVEGHRPEAIRLLDKGRVYLKQLETEVKSKQNIKEQLRKGYAELEAKHNVDNNPNDDEIIKDLTPCFYGNEDDAKAFLHRIRAVKVDKDKPAIAKRFLEQKKLSESSARSVLHEKLTKFGLYGKTVGNWNQLMNKA